MGGNAIFYSVEEAWYQLGISDSMKPSALVKIAAQAADFYLEAQKAMNRDSVKGLWEKVRMKRQFRIVLHH